MPGQCTREHGAYMHMHMHMAHVYTYIRCTPKRELKVTNNKLLILAESANLVPTYFFREFVDFFNFFLY